MVPYCFIGERECLYERPMPVQAVADVPDTRLLVIPRKIFTANRYFSQRDQEKLLIMSTVNFPDKKQVISNVDVVKRAHSIRVSVSLALILIICY